MHTLTAAAVLFTILVNIVPAEDGTAAQPIESQVRRQATAVTGRKVSIHQAIGRHVSLKFYGFFMREDCLARIQMQYLYFYANKHTKRVCSGASTAAYRP